MNLFRHRKEIINEFIRYIFVGGISFIADIGALLLFKELILNTDKLYSLYIATAVGFVTGLAVNYILSIHFVFVSVKGTKVGKSIRDILVFIFIGIIGLFLTEFFMFLGTEELEINYIIIKVIVTGIVLLWNYTARKVLIFHYEGFEYSKTY